MSTAWPLACNAMEPRTFPVSAHYRPPSYLQYPAASQTQANYMRHPVSVSATQFSFDLVEKSCPYPSYVDHHEAVSHRDVIPRICWAQDTTVAGVLLVIITTLGNPQINWLTASALCFGEISVEP